MKKHHKALGVDDVWDSNYTWTMNSWTQAVVWRYKAGLLSDPVVACAEELLCVYNNLEHTSYAPSIPALRSRMPSSKSCICPPMACTPRTIREKSAFPA